MLQNRGDCTRMSMDRKAVKKVWLYPKSYPTRARPSLWLELNIVWCYAFGQEWTRASAQQRNNAAYLMLFAIYHGTQLWFGASMTEIATHLRNVWMSEKVEGSLFQPLLLRRELNHSVTHCWTLADLSFTCYLLFAPFLTSSCQARIVELNISCGGQVS